MDEPSTAPRIHPSPDAGRQADDYRALTASCAYVDRSESGKLALTGAEAAEFLTGQVTADVLALTPGHGGYAALLTPKGKIISDLRVLAIDDRDGPELLLLCERSGLQDLFDHLRRHLIGFGAEMHKRTLQQSLLSVIGPRIPAALTASLGAEPHDHVAATFGGVPVRLVRTQLGVDVLSAAEDGPAVVDALAELGVPAVDGETAEIVRVEAGIPRLHLDMDTTVMPAEAGIVEQAVSFTKGCYVGQETVARLHWRGRPNRHLRGLRLDGPVPVGTVLVDDGREVGRVTSSVVSPRLGPIALALVRREIEPEQTVRARPDGGEQTGARVIALPFLPTPPAATA